MNYQNRGSTAFMIENIVSVRAEKIMSCGNLEQTHHSAAFYIGARRVG